MLDMSKKLLRLNWLFIGLLCLISSIGFLALYSAAYGDFHRWTSPQLLRFIVFFPVMLAISLIDIRLWFRVSYLVYAGGILLLLSVEPFGTTIMGAQRWIRIGGFSLQPSEFMKLCIIFALARYFHSISLMHIRKITYLFPPLLMVLVPFLLVLKQPDLGQLLLFWL